MVSLLIGCVDGFDIVLGVKNILKWKTSFVVDDQCANDTKIVMQKGRNGGYFPNPNGGTVFVANTEKNEEKIGKLLALLKST